ncbi:MAG: hypothetical protein F4Y53_02485 [Proteobacteria bacterium]|nr:hypothetical protein [Pseudomonadota bacterium]
MADKKKGLNGSTKILADAMKQVFTEAMEPVHEELSDIRENMATKDDLKTTNDNVQAQLAQHRKDITSDVKRIVSRK